MLPPVDRRRFRVSFAFLAKAVLVIGLVWALLNAVWLARDIVFIGFLALLFGLFLAVFVDPLERFMPRWLATLLVFLTLVGVLTGFFLLTWPSLQSQITTVREEVPRIIEGVTTWVQQQYRSVSGGGAGNMRVAEEINQRMSVEIARIVAGALPLLNTVVGALGGLVIVVVAGIFLCVNPGPYLEGFLAMVPRRGRSELRDTLREAGHKLRMWMAGMSISMLVIFALTTTGLWLLGVPAFLALGIIAGLLVFIPFVGPILSAIPAIALGFTISPLMALWVALLYLGIQQIESNALTPIVMKKTVDLAPALMLLFQMAMAVLFGFIGLLVAVPLLAAVRVLVVRLYVDRLDHDEDADD